MKKVTNNTEEITPHVEEPKNYFNLSITGDGVSTTAKFNVKGFNVFEVVGLLNVELAKHYATILAQTQPKEEVPA